MCKETGRSARNSLGNLLKTKCSLGGGRTPQHALFVFICSYLSRVADDSDEQVLLDHSRERLTIRFHQVPLWCKGLILLFIINNAQYHIFRKSFMRRPSEIQIWEYVRNGFRRHLWRSALSKDVHNTQSTHPLHRIPNELLLFRLINFIYSLISRRHFKPNR